MPSLKLGRISRRFGFLLATLHLTSLAITVGKLCLVHADSSFFQSPSLSDTHVQLAPTTVYSQIIVNSLRQKRNRCKILLPQNKNVVWFTRGISVLEPLEVLPISRLSWRSGCGDGLTEKVDW